MRQATLAHDLRERVKELTALHRCARLLLVATASDELFAEVAALLPPAFQYPECATGCVRYGGRAYATPGHATTPWMVVTPFATADGRHGEIEVAYHEARPDTGHGTGPFQREEIRLLGSLSDMLGVALDRRHAAHAARQASDRLNLALTVAGMGVWEWDADTDVMIWSEQLARLVGRDGELIGPLAGFRALIHPDDLAHLIGHWAGVRADDGLHTIELRLRRPDGGWRPVAVTGRIFDGGGRSRRILGVVMDITTRRALESGLVQAQKLEALGHVAGGVAHDFNNLLTVVMSTTELLQLELPAGPVREMLDEIHAAGAHGAALARQLLTFSRKAEFRPAAVELNPLIERLQPLLQRIVGRAIDVRTALAAAGAHVWADASQLEQLLLNLVVNARDAMPAGGTITIATELDPPGAGPVAAPARHASILVRDTGTGISRDVIARMFEPFFTTKEPGKGTGLGLAVVRAVAQQWHGDVSVDSTPGRGATFRVRLPLFVPPPA